MKENLKKTLVYVGRQLEGDRDPANFRNIISALRSYTHGIVSMREIGDFYAHQEGREKGLVTDHCRIFFEHLHFKLLQMRKGSVGPEFPSTIKRIARYVLQQLDGKEIYTNTDLGKKDASRLLESVLAKLENKDSKLVFKTRLEKNEEMIFNFCLSWIVSRYAFASDDIIKDYARMLTANKLITAAGKSKILALKDDLSLHLIDTMQKTIIHIDKNNIAKLVLHIDQHGCLNVAAVAKYIDEDGEETNAQGLVLSTNLAAKDWIHDDYYINKTEGLMKEEHFDIGAEFNDEYFQKTGTYPSTYAFKEFIEIRNRQIVPLV